ncbi:hypothetical protein ABEB36_013602 [Hypothenemus hampei]|uniref:Sas10 C-terminal domain-containing protein n=1 Tax=Hypothenemus hampei TaxID=57062 RepID=A0ABD1E515_HYPHA
MYEIESENGSSSEEELSLHKKQKEQTQSDSEVEVFGIGSDEESEGDGDDDNSDDNDDDEHESDIALSDVEGHDEDDNIPDSRAWGKQKKKYYGADYIDADFGGFDGKDVQAAEVEQDEANQLQNQLMKQLDSSVLDIDNILKKPTNEVWIEQEEELMKADLSKLSVKEKLNYLKKESPELFVLIDDFKAKMTLVKDSLNPILQKVKAGLIEKCKIVDFIEMYRSVVLNYATNIYMYLLLKSKNKLKNHPITQRLYQYRHLLGQIEPVFEKVVKPQIDLLLEQYALQGLQEKEATIKSKKKKTLKLLAQLQKSSQKSKRESDKNNENQPQKRVKLDSESNEKKVTFKSDDSESENDGANEDGDDKNGKRAITYQIAKNKGLTPYRKKEFRNPRVKHKIKYRKALIRRKGAVREPRKELSRYSGEISGIKASVSKSIKIKS